MPRIKCPKCSKVETVLRSGFIRNKQRYLCKDCNYNFTLYHEGKKTKQKRSVENYQTTIIDIAKAMGISSSTVSRGLRDHPDISKNTSDEIKFVAAEMDYHPNLVARNFAYSQTQTVGVIIPNLLATFFSSMLSGIQEIAALSGYKVIICQSNEDHKTEVDNIKALMASRVDGLLICHTIENESYDQVKIYAKKGIPIVHFYRVCTETDTSQVVAKNTEGAEKITEHLIERGCKKIALILGPTKLQITQQRLAGYKNILGKYNIPIDKTIIAYTDYKNASIMNVLDKWLAMEERPDAVFCISDRSAIYTIKYLRTKGIAVPEHIRIAGFGNDMMGELIDPGLTTYDVQTSIIGETAMKLFLQQILEGDNYIKEIKTVEGRIIIREST